jgi:hypothetical protein
LALKVFMSFSFEGLTGLQQGPASFGLFSTVGVSLKRKPLRWYLQHGRARQHHTSPRSTQALRSLPLYKACGVFGNAVLIPHANAWIKAMRAWAEASPSGGDHDVWLIA